MRVVQIDTANWPLRNKDPNFDSVADATTFLITFLSMYIEPLSGGGFCFRRERVTILLLK